MYYKIEKSGCCERKGKVQVRFDFFLDEKDYGFEKRYVEVPDFSEDFDFKREDKEIEADIKKLKIKKQLNPFHVHFYYFDYNVTDKKVKEVGDILLNKFYEQWKKDERPYHKNQPLIKDNKSITLAKTKVEEIKQWQI